MTYRIEHFVRKIKAPIVCRMDNEELSFSDGEELAVCTFDKYYIIDSVESVLLATRQVLLKIGLGSKKKYTTQYQICLMGSKNC